MVAVQQLAGLPIARAAEDAMVYAVMDFVARKMVRSFGPLMFIVSDDANVLPQEAKMHLLAPMVSSRRQ